MLSVWVIFISKSGNFLFVLVIDTKIWHITINPSNALICAIIGEGKLQECLNTTNQPKHYTDLWWQRTKLVEANFTGVAKTISVSLSHVKRNLAEPTNSSQSKQYVRRMLRSPMICSSFWGEDSVQVFSALRKHNGIITLQQKLERVTWNMNHSKLTFWIYSPRMS